MLDLLNDLHMVNAASSLQKSLAVQFLSEEDKASYVPLNSPDSQFLLLYVTDRIVKQIGCFH